MHSSRMRTARAMTGRISGGGGACHTCPPFTMHAPLSPCMPPFATHAPPSPCMPPFTMHAPLCHACPLLPRMPPLCHTCPPRHACPPREQPRIPPLWTECGHTLLKILPCPNFVAGGKYVLFYFVILLKDRDDWLIFPDVVVDNKKKKGGKDIWPSEAQNWVISKVINYWVSSN